MNRKLRFKQQRIYNLKIFMVSMVFVVVIFLGLLAVDLNKNYMLYGQGEVDLFSIREVAADQYTVSIMNAEFNVNLKYIRRDFNYLKAFMKH